MKCGNCKNDHGTVAQVRDCYARTGRLNPGVEGTPTSGGPVVTAEYSKPVCPVDVLREHAAKLPELPVARYAIHDRTVTGHWRFYRVDKPTEGRWRGYTFVKVQAGDEYHRLSFAESIRVLAAIGANPNQALADYGHQLGHCGICGRTLTNPESIELGIGPICAARMGGYT